MRKGEYVAAGGSWKCISGSTKVLLPNHAIVVTCEQTDGQIHLQVSETVWRNQKWRIIICLREYNSCARKMASWKLLATLLAFLLVTSKYEIVVNLRRVSWLKTTNK
jgi:hypothetical protein